MPADRHAVDALLERVPPLARLWWRHGARLKRGYCSVLDRFGLLTPSSFVLWVCTSTCNYRCPFCEASAGEPSKDELDTAEARRFIRDLPRVRAPRLLISGGEPLMRPDLPELLELACRLGIRPGLLTNGSLVEARWDRISAIPFFLVSVSLDGPPEFHDAERAGDNAFRRSMRAIDLFAKAGTGLRVVRTVVQPSNLGSLGKLRGMLANSGATEWQLTPVLAVGRALGRAGTQLSPKELHEMVDFVRAHKSDTSPRVALAESCGYLQCLGGYRERRPFFCGAGLTRCAVMPNGDVLGCGQFYDRGFVEGNVRATPLSRIWREGFVRYRRASRPAQCDGCQVWASCQGGCAAEREIQGECLKRQWDQCS